MQSKPFFVHTFCELYKSANWRTLLDYLKRLDKSEKLPDQWRWQIASLLNKTDNPSKAIDYIYPFHQKFPEQCDNQLVILEALHLQKRKMDKFLWIKKPLVRVVEKRTMQICYFILTRLRRPVPLFTLYNEVSRKQSNTFDEFDLLVSLMYDQRFFITNMTCYFRYSTISLTPHQQRMVA